MAGNIKDSCDCNAEIIKKNYERLEIKYINSIKEKLLSSIKKDPVLKESFLSMDSTLYKRLEIVINPILKLSIDARNYTFKEDICKYFIFDTINFDCRVGFFLDDTLCFSMEWTPNYVQKLNLQLSSFELLVNLIRSLIIITAV
jgi:hypothetical protein